MTFKDELKQEYHKYQENQQKIATGIHTLSEKFKDYILKQNQDYFDLQLKTFQTSLKTCLNKKKFYDDLKKEMLATIKRGELTYFISSDSWNTDLYMRLLNYNPSFKRECSITKAMVSTFLKNQNYKDYFKDTDCPTLKELTDKVTAANEKVLAEHYDVKGAMVIHTKLSHRYLNDLRQQLCIILEQFLTKEDLNYDLETEDNSDISIAPVKWTNNYLINLIE